MREPTYSFKSSAQVRLYRATLGLVLAFLVAISCDEVERHRVKTFFFDGVPPLSSQVSDDKGFDPNSAVAARSFATGGWYVHEPLRDCTQCHVSRRRASFSREVQLVAQVPQLCFMCHEEYTRLSGWVHGPVATGDCAFCHEPHKTRYPALLTDPTPDVCYQCHEPEALALVENHALPAYARCLECHEAHAGPSRYLLRRTFLEGDAGRPYRSAAYRQQYERARQEARRSLAERQGVSVLFRRAIDHVEAERLWEARAHLEVILESEALSTDERNGITQVLSRVMGLLEGGPDASEFKPSPDGKPAAPSAALGTAQEQRSRREGAITRLYYQSIQSFQAGQLAEARAGFVELLGSEGLTDSFRQTTQQYLAEIDRVLSQVEDEK